MSFLIMKPAVVASATSDLGSIGDALSAARAAAAPSTTGILAMAADEVSAAVTSMFAGHAQAFQVVSAEAAAYHGHFVNALRAAAAAYLGTEIANAQQNFMNVVHAPAEALLGNPLFGTGSAALPAAAIHDGPIPGFEYLGTLTLNQTGPTTFSGNLAANPIALAPFRALSLFGAPPAAAVASLTESISTAASQLLTGQALTAFQTVLAAPFTAIQAIATGTTTLNLTLPAQLVGALSSGAVTSGAISLQLGPLGQVGPAAVTIQTGTGQVSATVTIN